MLDGPPETPIVPYGAWPSPLGQIPLHTIVAAISNSLAEALHDRYALERGRVLEGRWQEVSRYLAGPYLLDPVHLACTAGREGLVL